jgi:hypothetical protein
MNFFEIKKELEARFLAWRNTVYPTAQILWENATLNNVTGWYFAINFLPSVSTDVEIGPGAVILSEGILSVRIIGPSGVGSGVGFTMASAFATAFENKKFSDIVTDAAQMNVLGEIENKFVIIVAVPTRTYR